MGKEVKRAYSLTDNEMLLEAKTKVQLAQQDIAELSKVEPNLSAEKLTELEADVDSCLEDYSSMQTKNAISITTSRVNEVMVTVNETVAMFFFQCERAFADAPGVVIEFGKRNVEKSRRNAENMLSLLSMIIGHYRNPNYKSKLDIRLGNDFIDNLDDLKDQLSAAIVQQALAKTTMPAETEERILRYNAVWEKVRSICEAAKFAFRNSYAKQQQYTFYEASAIKPEIPEAPKTEVPQNENL